VGVFGDNCGKWEKEEMGGGSEERLEALLGAGTGVALRGEVMTPIRWCSSLPSRVWRAARSRAYVLSIILVILFLIPR
jgi:hypothetical protein